MYTIVYSQSHRTLAATSVAALVVVAAMATPLRARTNGHRHGRTGTRPSETDRLPTVGRKKSFAPPGRG